MLKYEIIVLMATYNGERYLKQQLDSIVNQTYSNWKLLIRDDGSTDKTLEIIKSYILNDKRIILIQDNNENLGQCANFSLLLDSVPETADLIMFSDQDDEWQRDKIEISKNSMVDSIESDIPTLLYTNYYIKDEKLGSSKIAYRKDMLPQTTSNRLLVQNWLMGCTMMLNRSLLKLAISVPKEADNHDNWVAILSSLCGEIIYIGEPTMVHLLHENNVTTKANSHSLKNKLQRTWRSFKTRKEYINNKKILANILEERLLEIDCPPLRSYQKMLNSGFVKRLYLCFKNKFYGYNFFGTLVFFSKLI